MTFNWEKCKNCDRKYIPSLKEKHYEKYHSGSVVEIPIIPFEHNAEVKKLLRRSRLQVVKQKPDLLIRIAPFNHQPTSVGDMHLKVGQTYKVEEMKQ